MTTQRLPPPRKNLRRDIRELMNVKRGKDLHAFRRRHLEPLYRLARVLCRDEAAAQDLAVAALGDCLERSSTWSRDEQLHAWLHARLVVAWLRQQKQEGTVVEKSPPVASDAPVRRGRRRRKPRGGSRPPQPTGPQRPSEPDGELAFSADGYLPGPPTVDWSGTVADVDSREQLLTVMEAAARSLPARLRVAWALCDVCGHDAVETGHILDLSRAAVASRLHRARLILRAALERHIGQPAVAAPATGARPPVTTCQEATAALWADLEGSLPEVQQLSEALEAHLAACPACVVVRNTYRATVDLAARLTPAEPADALEERLRALIDGRLEQAKAEKAAAKAALAAENESRGRESRGRRSTQNDKRGDEAATPDAKPTDLSGDSLPDAQPTTASPDNVGAATQPAPAPTETSPAEVPPPATVEVVASGAIEAPEPAGARRTDSDDESPPS